MDQPAWLAAAWGEFGVREAAGTKTNARVLGYFKEAGHRISDDSVPWCAAFVTAMLKRGGHTGTASLLARSFLNWGQAIGEPRAGAIAVLTRGDDPQSGHVGFVVGTAGTNVFLLGGNQSDGVTVEAFDGQRILGFRWPAAKDSEADPRWQSNDVFAKALIHVLQMEGGFSDDPHDPGGPTNRGITLAVYARFKGETVDAVSRARLVSDLKRISDEDVREIYLKRYWLPSEAERFAAPLALLHFDASVNHGVAGAARLLQTAVGAEADGEIGPLTLAAIARRPIGEILAAYAEVRRQRYRALRHFWRFGRCWLRRVDATLALAEQWARETGATHGVEEPQHSAKGETPMIEQAKKPQIEIPDPSKWWGQSRTVWGTVITAVATVLPLLGPLIGIEIPSDVIKEAGEKTVTTVQAVAGLIGTLLALYGRVKAVGPLARKDVSMKL